MHIRGSELSTGSKAWLKLALIILVVGIADGCAVVYLKRPAVYAALIGAMTPLLTVALVVVPLIRERDREREQQ